MPKPSDLLNDASTVDVALPVKCQRQLVTAATLQKMVFPDPRYVVPGIVPEGLTILAGAPKLGKSWMALGMATAVATGGIYLSNTPCVAGDVLFLGLEDHLGRLQDRLSKIIPAGNHWPSNLVTATNWATIDDGGLEDITQWIEGAGNPRLVVIDVLTHIRPHSSEASTQYRADYKAVSMLQKIASAKNIGILVLHHSRKAGAESDPFDSVSGTYGLTGAADAALLLERNGHGTSLYGRGRDLMEFRKAVTFSEETYTWNYLGEAAQVFVSNERKEIIRLLHDVPGGSGSEQIAEKLGKERSAVDQLLSKMVKDGEIKRLSRGLYAPIDT